MDDALSKLLATYGVEEFYISATGEYRSIADEVKLGILDAMGIHPNEATSDASGFTFASSPAPNASVTKCFVPDWLLSGRAWGLTAQLYGVRSDRNSGIGDFEDLARLAELAAGQGADFIGVNPLHALIWENPDRCSPYFPSTRQFLSPWYIAIDRVQGGESALQSQDPALLSRVRDCEAVDYTAVSRLKSELLREIFDGSTSYSDPSFLKFCEEGGDSLEQFARFETLSAMMAEAGVKPGWPNWPAELQDSRSAAVLSLMADKQHKILWHKWMQWLAHEQLAEAQRRARQAGMRIGLYLDIAVGVAPDGAATWADPNLVTAKARIGCPPDAFNPSGQDWGLAPIIPSALHHRSLEPFEDVVRSATRFAGAIRIDHVMGIEHLYWIPQGRNAREGGYVRYPREQMLEVIGRLSQSNRTIVIGEDLGTVPHDFRDRMRESAIHSYRVFYFEREVDGGFPNPSTYPEEALACVGTHDLPTLRGWWTGADIGTRLELGLITQSQADAEDGDRHRSRSQLLSTLARANGVTPLESASGELPEQAVIDVHAYMASTPSRLFAAQLEDLIGVTEQVNLPGTHTEYPNWRKKLPIKLEEAFDSSLPVQTIAAIARARPRIS